MIARYHIKNEDGSNDFIDHPLHDCTEEDLAQFYAYDDESLAIEKNWENLMQINLKDTLKCLSQNSYEEAVMKPNSV